MPQTYLIMYKPQRENFINSLTKKEEQVLGEHFAYLQNLLAEKKLLMAGPCEDGSLGIAIIEVESQELAQKIMNNDPCVKQQVFSAEVKEFRLSLKY
ncbi:YciI family protein [Candidatus Uabimicrobium sp. HlEnr_7]|uniref:YciI family protein n=1 Tax=Candidatus Uabimicrobium helgolandensis TaxID=3095367 RepID=UPI003558EF9A